MNVAGAEVLACEIIRRLGPRLAPVVLCLDGIGKLGEALRRDGVDVVDLRRRPGIDLGVAGRLAAELRRRGTKVVHAHQYTPFFYSALAKPLVGRRTWLLFTEHGRHFPDVVSPRRRFVNRYVLSRFADEVNAVCQFSADALRDSDGFDRHEVHVVENGIDVDKYQNKADRSEAKRALGLDDRRRYVACIARFHPVKDHAMLLDAFARLGQRCPDVDLLLAGDGPLRQDLKQRAARYGLGDRVRFLGVRSDVPQLLAASDVFTLTSTSEAASLTLMEAMATGLPVVVTNVGGNPEIVREGRDGFLVPRGDAAAAADALYRLLSDPGLARAVGESARVRADQRYRLDRTVAEYHERYMAAARAVDPGFYAGEVPR
jgi:glycosyltransferase involved in cell wall biosynthesis